MYKLVKEWLLVGSKVVGRLIGGLLTSGPVGSVITTLTYGPSIAVDASLGNQFVVTVTDAVAFAIAAPTNTVPTGFGQQITITIRNASGGAHGAGTFNAVFKTSGAVPAIATGFSRSFSFRWNGTNWVELWRTAADVAN